MSFFRNTDLFVFRTLSIDLISRERERERERARGEGERGGEREKERERGRANSKILLQNLL